jgi:hypothetical protein
MRHMVSAPDAVGAGGKLGMGVTVEGPSGDAVEGGAEDGTVEGVEVADVDGVESGAVVEGTMELLYPGLRNMVRVIESARNLRRYHCGGRVTPAMDRVSSCEVVWDKQFLRFSP